MQIRKTAVWIVRILLAFLFLRVGFSKLTDSDWGYLPADWWGVPERLRRVLGAIEISAAIALLVPKHAHLAAAGRPDNCSDRGPVRNSDLSPTQMNCGQIPI